MGDQLSKITVEEYTSPGAISCLAGDDLNVVSNKMQEGGFRHMPVMENQKVIGILSDRELQVAIRLGGDKGLKAGDVMRYNPYIVSPQTPLEEVVFELSKRKIGSAIVLDESNDFLGIFTLTDALNAAVEIIRGETGEASRIN